MENKEISKELVLEDVISASIKIPGVKVDRDKFLEEQFASQNISLEEIIEVGPVEAGVTREDISALANKLIIKRTSQSSVASFVAGIPGGVLMAAAIPADVIQFFGMALRLAQELSYLYGAQDLWIEGKVDDDRVRSQLIAYSGVMFGVSGAASGVRILSTQIANTTLKKLPQKALTKTFWYPVVKKLGKAIGVKVTKTTVAKGVSKAIPVIGGVISGGLNFASMIPMAKRLNEALDKSTFDYSEEEFYADIEVMENLAEGKEDETEATGIDNITEVKQKVVAGFKSAKTGISGLASKIGKKFEEAKKDDPYEELKKLKELLDIGAITQDEFDAKKSEILKI